MSKVPRVRWDKRKQIKINECSDEILTAYYKDWHDALSNAQFNRYPITERRCDINTTIVSPEGEHLTFNPIRQEMIRRGLIKEGEY